jgi:pimeloyl-ACP methyl ester carboxylesterase
MARPLSPDELFPSRRDDISQRFVTLASGVRVRVAESGPQRGTPVVFVPGWGGAIYMFRHAFDELTQRGLRVIVIDPRGFGLSDKPATHGAYSLDAYIADLTGVLDALGLERAALVGQSMGGGIALHFAVRHPKRVSRLVLINPTGLAPLWFVPLLRLMPRAMIAAFGRRLVPRWITGFVLRRIAYGDPRAVTERDIDEYWAPTQLPGYVNAARATLTEFDWRPLSDAEAASLAAPAMVILGNTDRLIGNNQRAAKRLPGATVHCLAGGHCVHEEKPMDTYRLISAFLDGSTK